MGRILLFCLVVYKFWEEFFFGDCHDKKEDGFPEPECIDVKVLPVIKHRPK